MTRNIDYSCFTLQKYNRHHTFELHPQQSFQPVHVESGLRVSKMLPDCDDAFECGIRAVSVHHHYYYGSILVKWLQE